MDATGSEYAVPEGCRTKLDLYVTPAEAYERWAADRDHVKVLDVRTPEEYAFVGHPEMAMNIPFVMHTYEWEPEQRTRRDRGEPTLHPRGDEVGRPR